MSLYIFWICGIICAAYGQEHKDLKAKIRHAMENPDLFGGDMLVEMDDDRNILSDQRRRWPGGIIPYIIDVSLQQHTSDIKEAFEHYHKNTCVRFVPRKNEQNYIRIFAGYGCYAYVGMKIKGGEQSVSLGDGCIHKGLIVHELGHTLGMWHEQNRSDRDDYLYIYLENVQKGQVHNFKKLAPGENLILTPFDYDSIMIYGNTAFSKDGTSITMEAKNGRKLYEPYEKDGMTKSDIFKVRKMYKC